MGAEEQSVSGRPAYRFVVFGATGHLGQQLIDKLDESGWPIAELVGVASAESAGMEFTFRGEELDVTSEWPALKGRDMVFICTQAAEAREIVREALRAEVPCIDCSGSLANEIDVPMPSPPALKSAIAFNAMTLDDEAVTKAPALSVPSGTTLAWAPIIEAMGAARVVGTALCSASAQGRHGVVALSRESIALFNQADAPDSGPAGQAVAFDVIPGGGIDCWRVQRECRRAFGEALQISAASIQVPTFVGEGASLALELKEQKDLGAVEKALAATEGVLVARDGFGSRGLAEINVQQAEPVGPTLRDAIGSDEILVGRIEPDASMAVDDGWRLWIAFDPLRLVSDQALRLASRRLGMT
jgi:aspartate-semialdehyde dehydrogenase